MESSLLEQRPPGDSVQAAGTATLEADGFGAAVDAFAWEPDTDADPPRMRLWLLSLLGPQQAVKALWARLVRGDIATMRLDEPETEHAQEHGQEQEQGNRAQEVGAVAPMTPAAPVNGLGARVRFCALAAEGPRRWRFFSAALPASAGYHGLLVPEAALIGADRADFLIFPRQPADASALHYRYLNRRLDLPLHPAWSLWLWERAQRVGEARPLEARGIDAYRCAPDVSRLAADLSAALRCGALPLPELAGGREAAASPASGVAAPPGGAHAAAPPLPAAPLAPPLPAEAG